MKKIFLALLFGLFFIPKSVFALQKPSNVCIYDNKNNNLGCIDGNTANVEWGGVPVWQSPVIGLHSAQANYKTISYTFNGNLCSNGENFTINIATFGSYNTFLNHEAYIVSNGVRNSCSKQRVSENQYNFSCTGKSSDTWYIDLDVDLTRWDLSKMPPLQNGNYYFNVGLMQASTHSCSLNTGDVIGNQNNNTQAILEGIGSMGSAIGSGLGELKDNQDKNQEETNKRLDEANETSKGILGKIGDLLKSIVELPSKLVSLLLDGLKSLFVPTDDQLYEVIDDSKDLAENFGFVGESMNFFITIFTALLGMVNANGCVEFPEFTIGATSLTPSITFWNARNVCLNDNPILSSNITTIRTITSIVLVALFINFAVSKFFSILNKNDSGTTVDVNKEGEAIVTNWTRTNGITTRNRR